jgi:hypothetical protein
LNDKDAVGRLSAHQAQGLIVASGKVLAAMLEMSVLVLLRKFSS